MEVAFWKRNSNASLDGGFVGAIAAPLGRKQWQKAEARWRFLIRTLDDMCSDQITFWSLHNCMCFPNVSGLRCDRVLHIVVESQVRCQIQIGMSDESVINGGLSLAELLIINDYRHILHCWLECKYCLSFVVTCFAAIAAIAAIAAMHCCRAVQALMIDNDKKLQK